MCVLPELLTLYSCKLRSLVNFVMAAGAQKSNETVMRLDAHALPVPVPVAMRRYHRSILRTAVHTGLIPSGIQ